MGRGFAGALEAGGMESGREGILDRIHMINRITPPGSWRTVSRLPEVERVAMFWSMSNRKIVMNFVSKLPEDTSLDEIARKIEFIAAVKAADEQVADNASDKSGTQRQRILDLVSKMPDDASIEDILEKVEFVAGIERGHAQALRREGKTVEEVRELVKPTKC
jgi:hypothetical protein